MTTQEKKTLADELYQYCKKKGADVDDYSEGMTLYTHIDVYTISMNFEDEHFEKRYKQIVELVNNKTK